MRERGEGGGKRGRKRDENNNTRRVKDIFVTI